MLKKIKDIHLKACFDEYISFHKNKIIYSLYNSYNSINIYDITSEQNSIIDFDKDFCSDNFNIVDETDTIVFIDANEQKLFLLNLYEIHRVKTYYVNSNDKYYSYVHSSNINQLFLFDETQNTIALFDTNKSEIYTELTDNTLLEVGYPFIHEITNKNLLIQRSNKCINVWSLETFNVVVKLLGSFAGFSLNKTQTMLATIPENNSEDINIYDTKNWKHIKTFNGILEQDKYLGYIDSCHSVCFSPDNKYIIATYFQAIKIFDFDKGDVVYRSSKCVSRNVAFSDDGKYICFNDGEGLKLFEFDFS